MNVFEASENSIQKIKISKIIHQSTPHQNHLTLWVKFDYLTKISACRIVSSKKNLPFKYQTSLKIPSKDVIEWHGSHSKISSVLIEKEKKSKIIS